MVLTGRAALLALVGVLVVFLTPLGGATVAATAIILALALVGDVSLAASPRRVGLGRDGATSTRLGEPAEVHLVVRNDTGRRLRGAVRDAWPPSARAEPRARAIDLLPGSRRVLTTTLHPVRRGERRAAAVTLRTLGPMRLAGRQHTRAVPWVVQVLPPFTSRRLLPEKLARLRELDGALVAPVRGQGTEFDSLREYVDGDDPRSIDWRATARRRDVVVRTWRPERDRRLLLVLDSGRTSAALVDGAPRFDTALDAALLLTSLARHAGDRVGVLVHDRAPRAHVDASRGTGGLSSVVRATASVEPTLVETDMRGVVAQTLRRLPKRSLVVLFTPLDVAAMQAGLLPALPPLVQRHTVVVAAVSDPAETELRAGRGDTQSVYAAAAAEATDAERRACVALLHRRGVLVTAAPPATFASRVADTYLDLKAAGRL